jgi:metal-sulfur cluster biosynthetic enzyme/rhodanese-related sulfurtransferase
MVFVVAGAGLALGVALWRAGRRLRDAERRLEEFRGLRRDLDQLRGDLDRGLTVTRTHLALVAGGDAPERDVILHGRAFTDIQAAPALVLYEQTPELFVLDVRTEAEHTQSHIPRSKLIPLDELEDRLQELPSKHTPILVHCASGGRSVAACRLLADHAYARLLNLAGGMDAWPGPREGGAKAAEPPPGTVVGTSLDYRGGPITTEQVVAALRECFDPEIPLNIYDLGLVYGVDVDESTIGVKMTLTSQSCPSARTIPLDVKQKVAALGQPNVTVEVVWNPPWHPSRISSEGKEKLGLT